MSYFAPTPTGGSQTSTEDYTREKIRKLTASQGARSALYEVVHEPTGKMARWQRKERAAQVSPKPSTRSAKNMIAEREHIGRLLRDCQTKSQALLDSTDPIDSALFGANLTQILQELWNYKEVREDDWVEILNLLQIVLSGQEFETFSKEKRLALVDVFEEGLLTRTVGRTEVERTLELLSKANFDIWRGIAGSEEDSS